MKTNFNEIDRGIYFVFYDDEKDFDLFARKVKNKVLVNLKNPNSIIVNTYFRKNKLKFCSSLVKSFSNAPQETFSVVANLINENKNVIFGTVGLSYDSIFEIYYELKLIMEFKQNIVFICHQRKNKKGVYEIFNGESINVNDIRSLFVNS